MQTSISKNESDTLKLSSGFRQGVRRMAEQAKEDPQLIEVMRSSSPSVADALEMLNRERESTQQNS